MYYRYIIFSNVPGGPVVQPKISWNMLYNDYDLFEKDVASGLIFPTELKCTSAARINLLLAPMRGHFVEDKRAVKLFVDVSFYNT